MHSSARPNAKFHTELLGSLGVHIVRLVTDSRAVQPGDTFVAYPGEQADGRQFIAEAIANGANAVIWEAHGFSWDEGWRVPHLSVRDLRHHAGEIADFVYGAPSEQLWMVGVTGTNGKTSCSHWLAQALGALGKKTALVGTLGNGFPGALQATLNTTPDAIRLHGLFAEYLRQGAQAVVMEVSSHALAQGRVNGVRYDVALLTNLSRDHLDYHGDMESYAAAKRRLFDWQGLRHAVVNLDDAFGAQIAEELLGQAVEVVGYGLSDDASWQAERMGLRMVYGSELRMEASGLWLQLQTSWGAATLDSRMVGRFNASNLLASLAVLLVSEVGLNDAVRQLAQVQAAPGRMQSYGGGGQPLVVVDYAHTPDALEKVLLALRELVGASNDRTGDVSGEVDAAPAPSRRLICVFGCGGDRDRGKRPMMGRVAEKCADVCIVTSDNPRNESPQAIMAEIISGMQSAPQQFVDRAAAIAHAISEANCGDTVLVAGKGHEAYQEVAGVKHPFSDSEQVLKALREWRG